MTNGARLEDEAEKDPRIAPEGHMERRRSKSIGLLGAGVLAAAVLLAVASLAACGSGSGGDDNASPAAPKTIEITPAAQTGTTVEAAVGDTIVVSLEANPTTGYTWEFTAGDTISIAGSKYVADPNPDGLSGVGGTQLVTLTVTKAGASDLTGMYRQQWISPSPAGRPDFSMTVQAK
jgi:inhibitor of cysteine peptidase